MEEEKEKFLKTTDAFITELIWAYNNLQFIQKLKKRTEDRLEELNFAPTFFTFAEISMYRNSVITLCKITKDKKGEYTLYKLFNFLKYNYKIFSISKVEMSKLIESYKAKLLSVQVTIDKLFVWRDKTFVHNDAKYFLNPSVLEEEASVTFLEIDDVIYTILNIINNYFGRFYDAERSIEMFPNGNPTDIEIVLDILHEHELERKNKINLRKEGLQNAS